MVVDLPPSTEDMHVLKHHIYTELLTTLVVIRQELFLFAVISCLLLKLLVSFKFKVAGSTLLSLQHPKREYEFMPEFN